MRRILAFQSWTISNLMLLFLPPTRSQVYLQFTIKIHINESTILRWRCFHIFSRTIFTLCLEDELPHFVKCPRFLQRLQMTSPRYTIFGVSGKTGSPRINMASYCCPVLSLRNDFCILLSQCSY